MQQMKLAKRHATFQNKLDVITKEHEKMISDHKIALAEREKHDIIIDNKYMIIGDLETEMDNNNTRYEIQLQEVGIKMDKVKQR